MSDGMNIDGGGVGGGDAILAAEYVLHLLPAPTRRAVEERLEIDGSFRRLVASWSEDLTLMTDEIAPVDPPADVRERLAKRLNADATVEATPGGSTGRAASSRGWFSGFLTGGIGLAAAVAALAVFLPQVDMPSQQAERYAADILSEERALVVNVRYDATDNVLVIRKEAGTVAEGRDLEVWLLTEDQPPHSVGILPEGQEVRIDVSPFWGQRIPAGSFAVSDEPAGGSPTGLPTGEVIAAAPVSDA